MKSCNLHCEYQHEGFCTIEEQTDGFVKPEECHAKTDDDLETYCPDCDKIEKECVCGLEEVKE